MRVLFFLLAIALPASAASLSGLVRVAGGAALPGAEVLIQSESSGARWKLLSDGEGRYATPDLPPGRYKVTVRQPGFRTVTQGGVDVGANTGQLDFDLEFLVLHQMITVIGSNEELDPSGGSSLHLTRHANGANLPVNGRDVRSTFDLVPGVATVAAANSDGGQFTSNGQRPNANSFRVDGVSANTGIGGAGMPGSFPGASLPAMSGIGTTNNLVSPEAAADVQLHTFNFAPEFGERLGAESFVASRSGGNEYHGTAFAHYRDRHGTAPDWFANSRGTGFPRPFYNTFGGVVGGPIWRNKAFFFASGESSYIRDSGVQLTVVPSLAARDAANDQVRYLLTAFPYPTGRDWGDGQAEANLPLGRTGRVNTYSMRADLPLGSRGSVFVRQSYSSSQITGVMSVLTRDYLNASRGRSDWYSTTAGYVGGVDGGAIHDIRFNYSRAVFEPRTPLGAWLYSLLGITTDLMRAAGEVIPVFSSAPPFLACSIQGLGQYVSSLPNGHEQRQFELRGTFANRRGRHQLQTGVDGLRIIPSHTSALGIATLHAPSVDALVAGKPMPASYSLVPQESGAATIVSLFAQDTVALTHSLSVLYGLRWELTPPVAAGGAGSQMLSGLWTAGGWQSLQISDGVAAPWRMHYGQIAPRIGLAWRLPTGGLELRAGAGLFFDTRLGPAVLPATGGPFNSWQLDSGVSGIPVTTAAASMAGIPVIGTDAPDVRDFLAGRSPGLQLPRSYQWRVALQRELGHRGVLSASYIGTAGRHLFGYRAYLETETGILRRHMATTENSSIYHAFQLGFSGPVARRTFASTSYTGSHSIDDGSLDSSTLLVYPGYRAQNLRSSSSFDVRHTWTSSVSHIIGGVAISAIFRMRSGFPIDISNGEQPFGRRFDNVGRPDLVGGQPIWLSDPTAGGGRRLNPAAFTDPAPGRLGNLSRNAIRGFGMTQLDMRIHRDFRLPLHATAQLGISAYNILNHPSFADPVRYRSSHWFGQSTSMQNVMLGLGTPSGGLPTLFQTGGARAVELSVHLSF